MFVSLKRTLTWRLHTNLYKFGWHTSANNARMKNSKDLILGNVVCISIIYRISDSWLFYCMVTIFILITWLVKTENNNLKYFNLLQFHGKNCQVFHTGFVLFDLWTVKSPQNLKNKTWVLLKSYMVSQLTQCWNFNNRMWISNFQAWIVLYMVWDIPRITLIVKFFMWWQIGSDILQTGTFIYGINVIQTNFGVHGFDHFLYRYE